MVLGCSPYKICELGLSSLKASKNLEFLRINLEFLRINSRIPRDCFASLAMTRILEFPKPYLIPRLALCHPPTPSGDLITKNSRIPYVIAREQSKGNNLLKFPTKNSREF